MLVIRSLIERFVAGSRCGTNVTGVRRGFARFRRVVSANGNVMYSAGAAMACSSAIFDGLASAHRDDDSFAKQNERGPVCRVASVAIYSSRYLLPPSFKHDVCEALSFPLLHAASSRGAFFRSLLNEGQTEH